MPTITDHALAWRDKGIAPVPVVWRAKYPSVPWKMWVEKLPPPMLVKAWFGDLNRRRNLGLVLAKGLTVLDFDFPARYVVWRARNQNLAETFTVRTGRGVHVYFHLEKGLEHTRRMEGGEIKATGLIVAPPSVHHTGRSYEVMRDCPVLTVETAHDLGVLVGNEPVYSPAKPQVFNHSLSVVEQIKYTIPILDYLQRFCKPFRVSQRMWMATCPFHADHKPSLAIYPHQRLCYCFNDDCRAHRKTDVINCAMYYHNLTVQEAIRLLRGELDSQCKERYNDFREDTTR